MNIRRFGVSPEAGTRLPGVVNLDTESKIHNHLPYLGSRLPRCGQIAVHEHRIGRIQGHGLKAPQVMLPSAGDSNLRAWMEKAK